MIQIFSHVSVLVNETILKASATYKMLLIKDTETL